ncbi:hypothetical protein [Terriglobus sp. ADX1]|uniref:hypothetical protein n=1 Tax=Terriglobus sp. ADX1 TaxID=2794063 RepID=UPI002FE59E4A
MFTKAEPQIYALRVVTDPQLEWSPATQSDHELVLKSLDSVLASPTFRSSRRYPAMLRYITEKTLEGHPEQLKERTIGIEVFGRDADYDTHEDPVVRISASEIRKRLAQFYRDATFEHAIEFRLPLGTYVPQILKRTDPATLPQSATPLVEVPGFVERLRSNAAARPVLWYGIAACSLLAFLLAGWSYLRLASKSDSGLVERVWMPLLENQNPVLISTGRPVNPVTVGPEPADINIQDHIIRPEFRVSTTTAKAIANIAGFLQIHKKPFTIHDSESNVLSDFHERPIVLVNANDNKWTLQLMKDARFQFTPENVRSITYIRDAKHPTMHDWNVDFLQPFHKQTVDYAIVSRFTSSTTHGPVFVIAGISSNGTEAAGEFVVEQDKLTELFRQAPANWSGENFEAVLKVEVVDGNTGNSTVIASEFW